VLVLKLARPSLPSTLSTRSRKPLPPLLEAPLHGRQDQQGTEAPPALPPGLLDKLAGSLAACSRLGIRGGVQSSDEMSLLDCRNLPVRTLRLSLPDLGPSAHLVSVFLLHLHPSLHRPGGPLPLSLPPHCHNSGTLSTVRPCRLAAQALASTACGWGRISSRRRPPAITSQNTQH